MLMMLPKHWSQYVYIMHGWNMWTSLVDIALRTLKHVELLQADQAQQNPEVECIIFV